MTPDTVVELVDVVKEYPGSPPLRVLHCMSLAIGSGELVAVVGASGSGKSTMLSIMGTLDDPTSGTVLIDGTDAAALAERERAVLRARRIGFVFQQFFLLPALSAVENVALGLLYSGALDSTTGERILELLTSIADSGTAVVIITHDPHIAERTQRQISIHDGRIVSDTGSREREEVAA